MKREGSVYTSLSLCLSLLLNYSYSITSSLSANPHKLSMRARDWTGGGWGGIEELGSEERSDESVGHKKLPLTQTLWAPLARGKQPWKYLIARGTES